MILVRVICVVIGYLFGLFQTSYLYGRANHMDIREHGSGNAGTTNALRTMGKKAARGSDFAGRLSEMCSGSGGSPADLRGKLQRHPAAFESVRGSWMYSGT